MRQITLLTDSAFDFATGVLLKHLCFKQTSSKNNADCTHFNSVTDCGLEGQW